MKRDPRRRPLGERHSPRRLHGVRLKHEHVVLRRFWLAVAKAHPYWRDFQLAERDFAEQLKRVQRTIELRITVPGFPIEDRVLRFDDTPLL